MRGKGKIFKHAFVIAAFVVVAVFAPRFTFSFDVSTVITVIALLFAILVGFFFAAATSNYLRLQTLIADENAKLIAIFDNAQQLAPGSTQALADAIDHYMIVVLDHDLLGFAPHVRHELRAIVSEVNALAPNSAIDLFSTLHEAKNSLWSTNQEMSIASRKVLAAPHWVVLGLLAGCIDILLLSLRDGSLASTLFLALLITVSYLVLKLLNDVDTNRLLARQLSFDTPQEVFLAIGKTAYFPEYAIGNPYVILPKTTYRVGMYKNFPRSFDKIIRTVKPSRTKKQ